MKNKINKLLSDKFPMVPASDIDQATTDIISLINSAIPTNQTVMDEATYDQSDDTQQAFFNGAFYVIEKLIL